MDARLQTLYENDVMPALKSRFEYKNVMQIPRMEKVVLNIGVGEAVQNSKAIEGAVDDLGADAGLRLPLDKVSQDLAFRGAVPRVHLVLGHLEAVAHHRLAQRGVDDHSPRPSCRPCRRRSA